MNPMLEPFLYEAAIDRQSELRNSAPPVVRSGRQAAPSARGGCVHLRWRWCDDRVMVIPRLWRLPGRTS
jgi:hypothetical protein